ncbi:abc transporter [Moniliophthora roreri]|nr:abc transporter [Moniliophthora roreri]
MRQEKITITCPTERLDPPSSIRVSKVKRFEDPSLIVDEALDEYPSDFTFSTNHERLRASQSRASSYCPKGSRFDLRSPARLKWFLRNDCGSCQKETNA